jgi:hypothetical protein
MADKNAVANHSARHPQSNTAATASGIDAMKPIMLFQVSMLRVGTQYREICGTLRESFV